MSDPVWPASVYDALFTSVAEALDVGLTDAAEVLSHCPVFSDGFWIYWDEAVTDAVRLFCDVTGHEKPADED